MHEVAVPERQLLRDLEAAVLESYFQLGSGNITAYAGVIARDQEICLLGVAPTAVLCGLSRVGLYRDRRLFRSLVSGIYSKYLVIRLASDAAIGWIADELSYRVSAPGLNKEAAIPIRHSAVYVRDVDQWAMVQEHLSYPLSTTDVLAMARQRQLVPPRPLCPKGFPAARPCGEFTLAELADLEQIAPVIAVFHTGTDEARGRALAHGDDVLLLWPAPEHEFRGAQARRAPRLGDSFAPGTRIQVAGMRAQVRGSAAWFAANLTATLPAAQGSLAIGMRATYVLENRPAPDGRVRWQIVQVHVSVPITEPQLSVLVFGPEPT